MLGRMTAPYRSCSRSLNRSLERRPQASCCHCCLVSPMRTRTTWSVNPGRRAATLEARAASKTAGGRLASGIAGSRHHAHVGQRRPISPTTAQRLSVITGDLMEVQVGGRHIQIPALVVPGHVDDALTLHFGYGRAGAEAVADCVGVNVYPIWPGDRYSVTGATVSRMPGRPRRELAITQPHRTLETSAAARLMTASEFARGRSVARPRTLTLYQPPVSQPDAPAPHQWAMTIDLPDIPMEANPPRRVRREAPNCLAFVRGIQAVPSRDPYRFRFARSSPQLADLATPRGCSCAPRHG